MPSLLQKQIFFSKMVAELIRHANYLGYGVTFGEAWRPDETAAFYAAQGKGIKKSLHRIRLAVDLNLFKDGKWLTLTEHHKELGEWWESQSTDEYTCVWGGRFNDGNHYGISHDGVK